MNMTYSDKTPIIATIAKIAAGILLLINADFFVSLIYRISGVCMLVAGVYYLIQYFTYNRSTGNLTRAIIWLVLGAIFAFGTSILMGIFPVLMAMFAILLLISGIAQIQVAVGMVSAHVPGAGLQLVSTVLTIVIALLVLFNPFDTVNVLWKITGVLLIINGLIDANVFRFMKNQV